MKKLIKMYQAYRDKKFKARLERVLNNGITTDIKVNGDLNITGDYIIKDIELKGYFKSIGR